MHILAQIPPPPERPNERLERALVWCVNGAQNTLQRESMLHIIASALNKRVAGGYPRGSSSHEGPDRYLWGCRFQTVRRREAA